MRALGGHQTFPGGTCTPAIPPVPAIRPRRLTAPPRARKPKPKRPLNHGPRHPSRFPNSTPTPPSPQFANPSPAFDARALQIHCPHHPKPTPELLQILRPRLLQHDSGPLCKSTAHAAHGIMRGTRAYGERLRPLERNQKSDQRRGRGRATLFSRRRNLVGPAGAQRRL